MDAIWMKIRDGGVLVNKACHAAVGVDVEGRKQVLGLWPGTAKGRSSGPICTLRSVTMARASDIPILYYDGLTGLQTAVNGICPQTVVQTRVVRLLPSAMIYASWRALKVRARAMQPIYTAPLCRRRSWPRGVRSAHTRAW